MAVGVVTLVGTLACVFVALQLLPGGYASVVLGPRATEQARQAAEARYGLDRPVAEQFIRWLYSAAHGDLGTSLVSHQPVVQELAHRLPATVQVAVSAAVISVVLGVALGMVWSLAGRRPLVALGSRLFGVLSLSIPDFVLGMVLLLVASTRGWGLSGQQWVALSEDPVASLRSTLLPSVALGLGGVALVMRTLRESIASTLTEPYVVSAVVRGLPPRTIVARHVLRNSSPSSITVVALLLGSFLGGTVVVETIFSVPGIGLFFANSVRSRDFAVVQGVVLVTATVCIVANMLADVAHGLVDPRVARQGRGQR
ncbi:MAG: ABC transporter permease [Cellulomonadaceae bacterium]|nr:ABC transporter permease [Cellulomonadaceae bacterium]